MARAKVHLRLHDARIECHTWEGRDVVISIIKWDETPLRLRCREVVLVKEVIGDDLEELIECEQSELLREAALRLEALHYPDDAAESLRHFRLLDLSNAPVLEVIGQELIIE